MQTRWREYLRAFEALQPPSDLGGWFRANREVLRAHVAESTTIEGFESPPEAPYLPGEDVEAGTVHDLDEVETEYKDPNRDPWWEVVEWMKGVPGRLRRRRWG